MKFQIGDRVAVYVGVHRSTGRINVIDDRGMLLVDGNGYFNPKQCRKIKPKKLKHCWVWEGIFSGELSQYVKIKHPNQSGWILFKEVK